MKNHPEQKGEGPNRVQVIEPRLQSRGRVGCRVGLMLYCVHGDYAAPKGGCDVDDVVDENRSSVAGCVRSSAADRHP